jgi:hypothetical protein
MSEAEAIKAAIRITEDNELVFETVDITDEMFIFLGSTNLTLKSKDKDGDFIFNEIPFTWPKEIIGEHAYIDVQKISIVKHNDKYIPQFENFDEAVDHIINSTKVTNNEVIVNNQLLHIRCVDNQTIKIIFKDREWKLK